MENLQKGRGAQLNTTNKFQAQHKEIELDDRLIEEDLHPNPKTQFFVENAKKILSTFDSPDLPMGKSINAYQGCEHGCVYCYARNAHEYWGFSAGLDFETKIMVKQNAPQLLEKLFQNKNWKPSPIELSGNTDCYQPAEKKFQLTRQLLQIFLKYRNQRRKNLKNNQHGDTKSVYKFDILRLEIYSRKYKVFYQNIRI